MSAREQYVAWLKSRPEEVRLIPPTQEEVWAASRIGGLEAAAERLIEMRSTVRKDGGGPQASGPDMVRVALQSAIEAILALREEEQP